MTAASRHWFVSRLGLAGAGLGVAAGAVQALWGARLPQWSGAKQSPGALGLLTVSLSLLAGLAALRQSAGRMTDGARTACALVLTIVGLLCFSTVGRLWYLPGGLLVLAGVLTVDSWRTSVLGLSRDRYRVLLTILGASELIMVAGTATPVAALGAVGGILLIVAPWWRTAPRPWLLLLVLLGTVPFAAAAWTSIVPLLLPLAVIGPAAALLRGPSTKAGSYGARAVVS